MSRPVGEGGSGGGGARLQPARLHGTLDWAPPGRTLLAITPALPVMTDAILLTTLGGGIISCGAKRRVRSGGPRGKVGHGQSGGA